MSLDHDTKHHHRTPILSYTPSQSVPRTPAHTSQACLPPPGQLSGPSLSTHPGSYPSPRLWHLGLLIRLINTNTPQPSDEPGHLSALLVILHICFLRRMIFPLHHLLSRFAAPFTTGLIPPAADLDNRFTSVSSLVTAFVPHPPQKTRNHRSLESESRLWRQNNDKTPNESRPLRQHHHTILSISLCNFSRTNSTTRAASASQTPMTVLCMPAWLKLD